MNDSTDTRTFVPPVAYLESEFPAPLQRMLDTLQTRMGFASDSMRV